MVMVCQSKQITSRHAMLFGGDVMGMVKNRHVWSILDGVGGECWFAAI
jgi:hypothetical protein